MCMHLVAVDKAGICENPKEMRSPIKDCLQGEAYLHRHQTARLDNSLAHKSAEDVCITSGRIKLPLYFLPSCLHI